MNSTQSECTTLVTEVKAWIAERIALFQAGTTVLDKQHLLEEVQRVFPSIELDERQLLIFVIQTWQETKSETRHRTSEQWAAIFPRYPIGEDGFAIAFQPDRSSQILETFEEFGLVVVHVLDDEECARSRQAICDEINALPLTTRKALIDWQQPWTWEDCNWPMDGKFLMSNLAFHQQAFNNRTYETIYQVYVTLWHETRLSVNIDRWGITRGTCGLRFLQPDSSFQLQDREDWRLEITKHWDYNPWLLVQDMKQGITPNYQGLVAFADQDTATGCHLTLPGCTRFLEQWCRENTPPPIAGTSRISIRPKHDDPILHHMQAIPIRQGDLLIWSGGQLHSTVPNRNAAMRLHQYISMYPGEDITSFYATQQRWHPGKVFSEYRDAFAIERIELSALGRKLLGLENWV
jgi:hypothetical protein